MESENGPEVKSLAPIDVAQVQWLVFSPTCWFTNVPLANVRERYTCIHLFIHLVKIKLLYQINYAMTFTGYRVQTYELTKEVNEEGRNEEVGK